MLAFSPGNGLHLSLPINLSIPISFLLSKFLQLTQKYPSELNCPNQYRLQKQTLHVVTTLGSPQLSGLFQPVNLSHSPLHETDKKPSPWGVSQLLLQVGGHFRVDTSKAAAASSAFHLETWSSLGILQQGGGSHDPWTEVGTDGSCRCMVLTLVARMSQMWCHCDTVPRSTTCPKSNAA